MCKRLLRRVKELAREQCKTAVRSSTTRASDDRIAQLEIELMSHEWSLMRLTSLEQAGKPIGAEASILKIRGSEIQQELGRLLMECAGPYAIPYVPEALEDGCPGDCWDGAAL